MTREEEVAWAAGLVEGEGCFTVDSGQRQPRVQLAMTDEDVVRRFAAVIGRGNVRFYEKSDPKHQGYWQWSVQGRDDVLHAISLLWPFLGERRRERAYELVERAIHMTPRVGPREHCKRGHSLTNPANVYVSPKTGKRRCRTCDARRDRERAERSRSR